MKKYKTKNYRHEYVIGDLHGCFGALNQLLEVLDFDETQDKIWLTGDLVARGEHSLATLREVKRLSDIGALTTVLGNHDITLIATWRSSCGSYALKTSPMAPEPTTPTNTRSVAGSLAGYANLMVSI